MNRPPQFSPWICCLFGVVLCITTGCQQAENPVLVEQRTRYALTEEPTGALSVLEAREHIDTNGADGSIVVLGRIGSDEAGTWEPGKAAFVIVDPTEAEHDAADADHADNCPFCKAKQGKGPDPTALVKVLDEQGQVVAHDARKLFGLQPGQLVVVRGKPSVDGVGNLVLAADGVYLRR